MTQPYDSSTERDRPPDPSDSPTSDESPVTAPSGALVLQKPRHLVDVRGPGWPASSALERFATQLFDALDSFADRIATELGIR